MKVRWLIPEVNARRASLRYRCLYPVATLAAKGLDVAVTPSLETCDPNLVLVLDAWSLFPRVHPPSVAERLIAECEAAKAKGARVIVDNCDNQWCAPPEADWSAALTLLGKACRMADHVVCCSDELVAAMQPQVQSTAKFHVIDDPIEDKIVYPDDRWWKSLASPNRKLSWLKLLALKNRLRSARQAGRTTLIWFGSHGNNFAPGGMLDLLKYKELLETTSDAFPLELTIISNNRLKFNSHFADWRFPIHYLDWDRTTFISALKAHEVSLIPVNDNAFTRCKSANRLALSAYHGVSVLADPVPSYRQYQDVVWLGDWQHHLPQLLAQKGERLDRIRRARVMISQCHSADAIADEWLRVLLGAFHG